MSEMTEACVRGCGIYRQHLTDCDGFSPSGRECRGCLPRRATHGHLCDTCHRRLQLMLTDAPIVIRWLAGNLAGTAETDPDLTMWAGDRPELGSDIRLPINPAIYDLKELLRDRLNLWVDDWCEHKGLRGPDEHTPEANVAYLLMWLPGICKLDWIGDWCTEMAETMSEAHALAPWRPVLRRIPRVPCPGCEECNLAIYGGESDITCLSCGIMMTEDRFALWERVLKMDEAEEAS